MFTSESIQFLYPFVKEVHGLAIDRGMEGIPANDP